MENKYNIGLISKILNIPRSTLRYWESEGLINLKRNKENDYREFDVSSIFEILDIALYRKLNISIKEIKKMENQNVNEIEKVLIKNKENIDKNINELKYTKTLIEKRINQIQIYYELINTPYQKADKIENIKYIVNFDINNKKILSKYINSPENFVFYKEKNEEMKYGFILNSINKEDKILWQEKEDKNKKYVKFILKQDYYNLNTNLDFHIKNLTDMGYKTGKMIAKYLMTDFEGKKYDYYETYIEIK